MWADGDETSKEILEVLEVEDAEELGGGEDEEGSPKEIMGGERRKEVIFTPQTFTPFSKKEGEARAGVSVVTGSGYNKNRSRSKGQPNEKEGVTSSLEWVTPKRRYVGGKV